MVPKGQSNNQKAEIEDCLSSWVQGNKLLKIKWPQLSFLYCTIL